MKSFSYKLYLIFFLSVLVKYSYQASCYASNCQQCQVGSSSICSICNIGYALSGGQCYIKNTCYDNNCIWCSSYTKCTQCMQNYYISSSDSCNLKCESSRCNYCTYDSVYGNKCNTCNYGYYLTYGNK